MSQMKQNMNLRIRACRKQLNLSQEQVANALGITRTTYAHIEKTGNPSLRNAKVLAQMFRVSVEYLCGDGLEEEAANEALPPSYTADLAGNDPAHLKLADAADPALAAAEPEETKPPRGRPRYTPAERERAERIRHASEDDLDFTCLEAIEQDLVLLFRQLETQREIDEVFNLLDRLCSAK